MFYLNSNIIKQDIKSGWNKRYPLLCELFENEKKKEQKNYEKCS